MKNFSLILSLGLLYWAPLALSDYLTSKTGAPRLVHLTRTQKTFLFHLNTDNGGEFPSWEPVVDSNDVRQRVQLNDKDLLYGEERIATNGKRYLYIPLADRSDKSGTISYFIIPEEQPQTSGRLLNYRNVLTGEKRAGAYFSDQEDAYVYLDKPYSEVAPLTSAPALANADKCIEGLEGKNTCTGWPSSQEKLLVKKSQVVASGRDPETGEKKMELYYYVETQYKRKVCNIKDRRQVNKSEDICPFETFEVAGWIPAKQTLNFKREDTLKEDIYAYSTEQISQLKKRTQNEKLKCDPIKGIDDAAKLHAEALEQAQISPISSKELGKCLGSDYVRDMKNTIYRIKNQYGLLIDAEEAKAKPNKDKIDALENERSRETSKALNQLWKDKYQQGNNTAFDQYVREYWNTKIGDTKKESPDEFNKALSVDALARALYGEMRGVDKTSTYYGVVGRVLLNRAALIKKEGGDVRNFISDDSLQQIADPKKSSIFELIPHIVSSPKQISSLNANDQNLIHILCPNPQSEAEINAWNTAVAVANAAVYQTKSFLKWTECIPYVYYTSDQTPKWAASMNEVDLESLAKPNCHSMVLNRKNLMLWDETPLTEKIKKEIVPNPKFYSRN